MKKKAKKFFSLLLTLVMVLTSVPFATTCRAADIKPPYARTYDWAYAISVFYFGADSIAVPDASRAVSYLDSTVVLNGKQLTDRRLADTKPVWHCPGSHLLWQEADGTIAYVFGTRMSYLIPGTVGASLEVGPDGFLSGVRLADGSLLTPEQAIAKLPVVGADGVVGVKPTASSSATPVATASPSATPVATASPSATPVAMASPSATPVATASPSATPVATASPSATPVATASPSATPVATASPSATPVATAKPSATPVATASPSATPVATAKPSDKVQNTPRKSVLYKAGKKSCQVTLDKKKTKVFFNGHEIARLTKKQRKSGKRYAFIGITEDGYVGYGISKAGKLLSARLMPISEASILAGKRASKAWKVAAVSNDDHGYLVGH